MRQDKLPLAGHFSAKLRTHQRSWLPCELEALAIATATKHFSPYIIQSQLQACVLTDSKPCVEAAAKLCRGEFSASPRVATFASTISRYQVSVCHLAGTSNCPSDFGSRNAPACTEERCQVYAFIQVQQDATVCQVRIDDILSGAVRLPFSSRATWHSLQAECLDLGRTHANLKQGTRPSCKVTKIGDVKHYLLIATIANDGLVVVKQSDPLVRSSERIVVPRELCDGLLTALHLKLEHPTKYQLKLAFERFFFTLDLDKHLHRVSDQCHQCTALCRLPENSLSQTTSDSPPALGLSYALDVLNRARQCILVVCECVSSYTMTCLVPNKQTPTLCDAIIGLFKVLIPLERPQVTIRVDAGSGLTSRLTSLADDSLLKHHRIFHECGRIKNHNKNPVAEKAVQELEQELIRLDPTAVTLALAIVSLNKPIWGWGLSAWEIWFQRDMFMNEQVPVNDLSIIDQQHASWSKKHPFSEASKTPKGHPPLTPLIAKGDLVYLRRDVDKHRARDRYIVTSTDGPWYDIKKFTGSQLRNKYYCVKQSECYKVPSELLDPPGWSSIDSDEENHTSLITLDRAPGTRVQSTSICTRLLQPHQCHSVCLHPSQLPHRCSLFPSPSTYHLYQWTPSHQWKLSPQYQRPQNLDDPHVYVDPTSLSRTTYWTNLYLCASFQYI